MSIEDRNKELVLVRSGEKLTLVKMAESTVLQSTFELHNLSAGIGDTLPNVKTCTRKLSIDDIFQTWVTPDIKAFEDAMRVERLKILRRNI